LQVLLHYLIHHRLDSLANPLSKVGRLPKLPAFQEANLVSERGKLSVKHGIGIPVRQEGELTLKLLNLFLDAMTKFPAMEQVLVPVFHELVNKALQHLHDSTLKEGYLDLLLATFRAISVCLQT
jgi:hypothetical protein